MRVWNVSRFMRALRPILIFGLAATFAAPAAASASTQDGAAATPTGTAAAPSSTEAGKASPSTQAGCVGRPDIAALDEYCPTLPGADGRGSNRGPKLERVLPPGAVKRLERAGPAGQALLALSVAAPMHSIANGGRGRGLDADELLAQGQLGHKKEPPGNAIRASATAVTNGDVGAAFGMVLLVSSFALTAAGWLRYRRRHPF